MPKAQSNRELNQHPNQAIAFKTGDQAGDFTLLNTDGQSYTLSSTLSQGAVVLVFYRGDW